MINCKCSLFRINRNIKRMIIMKSIELGDIQLKFAEIVWENEPVSSGKLV